MKLLIVNLAVVLLLVAVVGLGDAQSVKVTRRLPISMRPPTKRPHTRPPPVPVPSNNNKQPSNEDLDVKNATVASFLVKKISQFYPEIRKYPGFSNVLAVKPNDIVSAVKLSGIAQNYVEYIVNFTLETSSESRLGTDRDNKVLYLQKYDASIVFYDYADKFTPDKLVLFVHNQIPYGGPTGEKRYAIPLRPLDLSNGQTRRYIARLVDRFVPDYRKRSNLRFLDSVENYGKLIRAHEILDINKRYDFLGGKEFFTVNFQLYALPINSIYIPSPLVRPLHKFANMTKPAAPLMVKSFPAPVLYNVQILVQRFHRDNGLSYNLKLNGFDYKKAV